MKKRTLMLLMATMLSAFIFASCGGGSGGGDESDATAPVPGGGGIIVASNITVNAMTISWEKATDNKTDTANLEYKVVMSPADNIGSVSAAEANGTVVRDWDDDYTSADVSGLSNNTNYYFNVMVRDEAGNTAVYTQKIAMTLASNAPNAGGSGNISTSDETFDSLRLSWSKADDDTTAQGELQYQVYMSTSNNIDTVANAQANGNVVHTWTPDLGEKVVSGLLSSSKYYFNVLVKDGDGIISAYNMCNTFTDDDDPALPGNGGLLTASNVAVDSVRINWTKATDTISAQAALQYKVVRSDFNNISTVADAESPNGTLVQDWAKDIQYADASGLDSSKRYYFNVLVKDEAGKVGVYTMNNFYTADDDSPVPGNSGTLSFGSITATSIGISWTKGSDPNLITPEASLQYKVVRSDAANIDTLANAEANGTVVQDWTADIASATAAGLTDSRKYYFNIIVRDLAGNKAAYSLGSATTLDTTVPVPGNGGTITTSGVTDTSVMLNWTKGTDNLSAQGALQYKVVRSDFNNISTVADAESNGTVVQDWTADINTKEVTGLSMSSTYYFNVLVKDEAGNRVVYAMKDATTLSDAVPPVPGNSGSINTSNVKGTSFYLTWAMATDNVSAQTALQYKVVKSSSANIDTVANAEANGTVVQDWTPYIDMRELVKLTVSTNYYYNVLVKDEAGNKAAYTMGSRSTGEASKTLDQANGDVLAMSLVGNILYLGGNFTRITVSSGSGAILDSTSGDLSSAVVPSEINGTVYACVPDGNGGWIIGGEFTSVRGITRNRIARINSDGTVHSWNPNVNGSVSALAVSGSMVYAGGSFTSIGGQTRNYIAAIDATTGAATSWNPNANSTVIVLVLSGNTVYAGGNFTSIGGQTRNYIAALDATTGAATSWNPNANSTVNVLALSGSMVFVGGNFSTIGGQTRSRIAAVDATTGAATSWNPNANNSVSELAVSGSTVYVGGDFTSTGGQTRNYIAALDATTGAATSWNPNANNGVRTLAVSGSTMYVGGYFTSIGGQARNYIAAIDATTGAATSWNPNASNNVYTLALSGSTVYAGGSLTRIGGQARNYIAAIDATTGAATSWNPNANDSVLTLAVSGSTVYVGGTFTSIGGQARNYIAALDATTGTATSWNPNASSFVSSLVLSGSTVYVGGAFTSIGGQARNYIAALDATTGAATSWNPNANNGVFMLTLSGSTVYVGGGFTSIGGQARNYIAALDATTGTATSWNPNANNGVRTLALSGSTVYVGGYFTSIGGQTRNYIAAIDATTGAATSWNPNASAAVFALAVSGSTVYAGGDFTTIGEQTRNCIAAIDATTGAATSWNPNANNRVFALTLSGSTVYVGGWFTTIGGQTRNYIAAIDLTTGLPY